MARRFRRRPPAATVVLLVLFLLLAARICQVCLWPSRQAQTADQLSEGLYDVVRVVDGDTIIVAREVERVVGGQTVRQTEQARIRLLGIDTPETVKRNHPVEPFGPEATAFTRQFVRGGRVRLQFDRRRVDHYDRFLAYVFVDDLMLNEELVRQGLARVKSYPGDSESMLRRFRRAEEEAIKANRGIQSDSTD